MSVKGYQDNMESWLRKHRHRLSLRAIEKEIGCPATTLCKVVSGTIRLPKKYIAPLIKVAFDLYYIKFKRPQLASQKIEEMVNIQKEQNV